MPRSKNLSNLLKDRKTNTEYYKLCMGTSTNQTNQTKEKKPFTRDLSKILYGMSK